MEIDIKKLEDLIVRDAVDTLTQEDAIWSRIQTGIDNRLNAIFAARAQTQIDAAIDKAITDGFDRSYQAVDRLGRPVGEVTTIAKKLSSIIDGYWNESVDTQGKPSTGYNAVPRAIWMMQQLAAKDFDSHLRQEVVNVAGQFKDSLRKTLHEHTNTMVSEIFHVKSRDDQTLAKTGRACIDPAAKPPEG